VKSPARLAGASRNSKVGPVTKRQPAVCTSGGGRMRSHIATARPAATTREIAAQRPVLPVAAIRCPGSALAAEPVDLVALSAAAGRPDSRTRRRRHPVRTRPQPAERRPRLCQMLDNARHATPPGGRITVRISNRHDTAEVEITDSGPGIPPVDREASSTGSLGCPAPTTVARTTTPGRQRPRPGHCPRHRRRPPRHPQPCRARAWRRQLPAPATTNRGTRQASTTRPAPSPPEMNSQHQLGQQRPRSARRQLKEIQPGDRRRPRRQRWEAASPGWPRRLRLANGLPGESQPPRRACCASWPRRAGAGRA
jgi:hypothetical protein